MVMGLDGHPVWNPQSCCWLGTMQLYIQWSSIQQEQWLRLDHMRGRYFCGMCMGIARILWSWKVTRMPFWICTGQPMAAKSYQQALIECDINHVILNKPCLTSSSGRWVDCGLGRSAPRCNKAMMQSFAALPNTLKSDWILCRQLGETRPFKF